jgi:hypothetical protein
MNIREITKIVNDALEGKTRVAFFVGAGISMEGNLCPGFSSLNAQVISLIASREKEFEDYLVKQKIAENERARPEIVLQIARDEIGPHIVSCLDTLTGENLNFYHRLLARVLQAGNWVFTTNFENRIEGACKEIGFIPNVCSSDEDFYEYLFHYRQKCELLGGYLFKLHGTINEEESAVDKRFETIVMTLNEAGKGLSKHKAEVLRTFLQEYEFIFIGYSCMDEFDINDVLINAKSDKQIIYFYYESEKGELAVVSERGELEREKDKEGQDRSVIHVDHLLLGRPEAHKVIGNPRNLMEGIYQFLTKFNPSNEQPQSSREWKSKGTFPWAQNITNDKRRLFFGRLLLHLGLWQDAIKYLSEVKGGERGLKGRAMRYIGDAWRGTEEERGYEEAINSYRDSLGLLEQDGDLASAAVVKAEMANVMRLAKKPISIVEEYVREAMQTLEREIAPGYSATLNILGLVSYQKRFEEEWKRAYWLEVASDLCEKSMNMGRIIGDQARIARAGNALSLILDELAKLHCDKDKNTQAIKLLESILPGREAAADLRLCFQINRNLGVTHKTKILFAETEADKAEEKNLSEKYFTESRKYTMGEQERLGQYLETIYREGELHFELGNLSKAVPLLREYVEKQQVPDRKATGLKLLGLAYTKNDENKQASEAFQEVLRIYEEMSDAQREELKGNPDRELRAKENLSEAINFFDKTKDNSMRLKAEKLMDSIENSYGKK